MNKSDFKIAARAFLKGKWYNFLNIAGLALGLTAFIFVTLYVDYWVLSGVFMTGLALVALVGQTLKAANENPVKNLECE